MKDPFSGATLTQPQAQAEERLKFVFTSGQIAEELVSVVATNYLWCPSLGWHQWTGLNWCAVPTDQVHSAVHRLVHRKAREALERSQDDDAAKGWLAQKEISRVRAITDSLKTMLLVDASAFDAHPELLNVANGVVDLRTGELLAHDPRLLLTKLVPVAYDPAATHPDWSAALSALPREVVDWYQVRVGQAATGYMPPDDVLIVQVGGGENGKTTLTAGIRAALGDYAVTVSHRALLGNADQHPTELMVFRGARFALLEETPEARRLSTVRLKQTVGTPTMRARLIRKDEVEWETTHSLFVSTNYRPEVEEADHGTWRRLVLVNFPYTFVKPGAAADGVGERAGDPGLRQRLVDGADGQHAAALAWIVMGARRWFYADKVMPELPEVVAADTLSWRLDTDLVLRFVDEHLDFDAAACVPKVDLLNEFNTWQLQHGHARWSDKTLSSRLSGHDVMRNNRVSEGRRRAGDAGVSRPPGGVVAQLPERFRVWNGLRFRPIPARGTAGTGVSGYPLETPSRGTPDSSVPTVPTTLVGAS